MARLDLSALLPASSKPSQILPVVVAKEEMGEVPAEIIVATAAEETRLADMPPVSIQTITEATEEETPALSSLVQTANAASEAMAQAAEKALKTIGSPSATKDIIAKMEEDHYKFYVKNSLKALNTCLRQHGFVEVGRGANRQVIWGLPPHRKSS